MNEMTAAQVLANTLANCYGVRAVSIPDVWEKYRRFMVAHWRLSEGQSKVAVECVKGKTNIEIAAMFSISPETANKHLDHIYRKARVGSRAELAALLLQEAGSVAR